MTLIEARLTELGHRLPPARIIPNPNRRFALQVGRVLHLSGHGPYSLDPSLKAHGKFGVDVSVEDGYAVSRAIALSMLASVKQEIGSLDRVVQVIKLQGMVNCSPDFVDIPRVIDGASDLFYELFGPDAGCHTRMVTGMASLANGICVELQADFEIGEPVPQR
ncbi:RidA family protein [soil metagenome]